MPTVAVWVVPICWVTFGIVWIVGAFTAKPAAEGQHGWRRWWYWGALIVLCVLLLLGTPQSRWQMTLTSWSVGPFAAASAVIITIAGLVIAVWSRASLGVYWSGDVVVKQQHLIIDRGPYRVVRHPIYLGVLLMLLGTALLWGRRSGLVLGVVALAGFTVKARLEEKLLSQHFPVEYGRYKARVKWALVPWLL